MRVLGIDPGIGQIGYAVVDRNGASLSSVTHGLIRTNGKESLPERLKRLHLEVEALIREYAPDCVATEALMFAANRKTAFQVVKALGVIVLAAAEAGLPWCEYKPAEVKMTVTGFGRADKAQVQYMVAQLLKLSKPPKPDDVADAAAVAICHASLEPMSRL